MLEIKPLLDFSARRELRDWLAKNGETEKCCWVLVNKTRQPKPDAIPYLDIVEEALCFGWIDGINKKISDDKHAQRLSPRTKKSNWTELNKERVRRLEKLGLMTEAGRECLPDMSEKSFKILPEVLAELKKDNETYNNFFAFPELYTRVRIDTIQKEVAYGHPELFKNRLKKLVKNTKQNKIYGDWHDGERLLNY
jgi:uncharacterized protein YdeI (YjbR/CyaY-like superfamily)